MMKFLVKKQQIDCIERDKLADGQIAFVSFRFVFDNEWEGLYKVVQFMQDENTYNISLGVDGYSCKMPSELQAGCAEMSLFGYVPDDETALRATTAPIKLRIEQSGFSSSGSEVVPPTPDLYQQLIAKIDEKIASVHDGADGASAYEIAVENGYTGTEAEWLSSLKGEKGDAGEQGIQGIQGEKGDTGEQGLQGIQGEKGEKGDTGAPGKDGVNGKDGANGINGKDGVDGFSPVATVTETDDGVVITITDKEGTTTATVEKGVGKKDNTNSPCIGEIFNLYDGNKAYGSYSHAEGFMTYALGHYSHSQGYATSARGEFSHSQGFGTNAYGDCQHVQGKNNVIDEAGKFAFIIGNGEDSNSKSNAIAIDWNGKIYVNNATDGVDVSALATQIGDIQTVLASIVEVEA